ncbi:MAG: hypothetical protein ACYCUG_14110 [Acidimicrobiales bacterium]
MTGKASPRWLRWYPAAWRDRYGDELTVFMHDSYGSADLPWRARLSLAAGGLRERARQSGVVGETAPPPGRVQAGTLLVLIGWAGFVVAGLSFAKFSEHFDGALPGGINSHLGPASHAVPDSAYGVLQTVALVAGIAVLLGAALAVPSLLRYLRSDGWSAVRGHVLRAVVITSVAAGTSASLIVWAHHLSSPQRNGANGWYDALFLVSAALMALTFGMWTAVAVAAGRRLTLSRSVLRAESAVAAVVGLAMIAMLGATAVWWASMATQAPSFLTSDPTGAPLDPWLVGTVVLMLAAMSMGVGGMLRVARNLAGLRG